MAQQPFGDYQGRFEYVATTTFPQRVTIALVVEVAVVLGEDPTTPLHAERVTLAMSVQANPGLYATAMAYAVVGDLGLLAPPNDPTLQLSVHNKWNQFVMEDKSGPP